MGAERGYAVHGDEEGTQYKWVVYTQERVSVYASGEQMTGQRERRDVMHGCCKIQMRDGGSIRECPM